MNAFDCFNLEQKEEKYINEQHCVICQEQDNVSLRECKGFAPLIEYANQLKLEVLVSHFLEKQQENQSVLIYLVKSKLGTSCVKGKKLGIVLLRWPVKSQKFQQENLQTVLIGKLTVCFVENRALQTRRILKDDQYSM